MNLGEQAADPFVVDIPVIADAVMALTALFVAGFGLYQFYRVRKTQRQAKSAEIMRIYARDLIMRVSLANEIFRGEEVLSAIVTKIPRDAPLEFTARELTKFGVTEKDRTDYIHFLQRTSINDIKHTTNDGRQVNLTDYLWRENTASLPKKYSIWNFMTTTLNDFEWIAMEIRSGAADSTYIYGSLHQSFQTFVHQSAILLQYVNDRSSSFVADEELYSYTTELYRQWAIKESDNYGTLVRIYKKAREKIDRRRRI